MTGNLVQFVAALSASPTVLLDINDEVSWWVNSFDAPPPRLRRSVANNAMRDGGFVSSASYENRVLSIGLDLRTASQDTWATEFQKLARILDGATSILKYQPVGASKPVFFKVFRSDVAGILDQLSSAAFRQPVVELLAEPFALGLSETPFSGAFSNNMDGGCYQDFTPLGDVPAPLLIGNSDASRYGGIIAMRQHGTPSDWTHAVQFDSGSFSTQVDTTNPGGGPDAAMSGTGTNNFIRTSFATTATMAVRARLIASGLTDTTAKRTAAVGTYRIIVWLRRSDNTSVMRVERTSTISGDAGTAAITLPLTTSRIAVDFGLFSITPPVERDQGGNRMTVDVGSATMDFRAARDSGTGTLDWDGIMLIPADESTLMWSGATESTTGLMNWDSDNEAMWRSTSAGGPVIPGEVIPVTGGFPYAVPGTVNRLYMVVWSDVNKTSAVTINDNPVTIVYNPRYLYVRPSAT